jgi:hypothetical protein
MMRVLLLGMIACCHGLLGHRQHEWLCCLQRLRLLLLLLLLLLLAVLLLLVAVLLEVPAAGT